MTLLIICMVLAALIGLSLSLYFFHYRTNLAKKWQWLYGVFGGIILGGCFLVFSVVILFPPVELWFTILGLTIMGLIISSILIGSKKD